MPPERVEEAARSYPKLRASHQRISMRGPDCLYHTRGKRRLVRATYSSYRPPNSCNIIRSSALRRNAMSEMTATWTCDGRTRV